MSQMTFPVPYLKGFGLWDGLGERAFTFDCHVCKNDNGFSLQEDLIILRELLPIERIVKNPFMPDFNLLGLPHVVHKGILAYLDISSKKSLRRTCTYFLNLVTPQLDFTPMLSDDSAKAVINRTFKCKTMCISNLISKHALSSRPSHGFSEIRTLIFTSHPCGHTPVSELNLFRLLRHCNNLEHLEITGSILPLCQITNKNFYKLMHLDNLRTLKLGFAGREPRFAAVEALQYARFPKLEELVIIVVQGSQQKLYACEYECITKMLINHHKTLQHLHIYDFGTPLPPAYRYNVFLYPRPTPLLKDVECIQLLTLEVVDGYTNPDESIPIQWVYAGTLIENQHKLKRLQLVFPTSFLLPMVRKAASKSSKTLTTFFHMIDNPNEARQLYEFGTIAFNCADINKVIGLSRLRIHSIDPVLNVHLLPSTLTELYWDAPINNPQFQQILLRLTNLQILYFGTVAGYLPAVLVIRTLRLPALNTLIVSVCNRDEVEWILRDWFEGILHVRWPYSPLLGIRIWINRSEFEQNLPNFEDLEAAIEFA